MGTQNEPYVDTVLILIYTGFRISELLSMKNEGINLYMGYFKGGMKTKSGKDRIVPIYPRMFEMVEKRAESGSEYFISEKGKSLAVREYYPFWNSTLNNVGINHVSHECRHTFRSRLDSAGANKACIDLIMGHKSKKVGERVYTHKIIDELKNHYY